MKRAATVLMTFMLLAGLTACGPKENEHMETVNTAAQAGQTEAAAASEQEDEPRGNEGGEAASKSLVVYFSATGNTRAAAEALAEATGADLYEIVPEQPYTDDDLNYNDRSSRATVEQNDENARPAISGSVEHMEDYDVVYVGFPIWWGDLPRILCTFFDSYDLSGKTIAPFATSGGSGISRAVQSIESMEPEAQVTEGLLTSASGAENDLLGWLKRIGLAE